MTDAASARRISRSGSYIELKIWETPTRSYSSILEVTSGRADWEKDCKEEAEAVTGSLWAAAAKLRLGCSRWFLGLPIFCYEEAVETVEDFFYFFLMFAGHAIASRPLRLILRYNRFLFRTNGLGFELGDRKHSILHRSRSRRCLGQRSEQWWTGVPLLRQLARKSGTLWPDYADCFFQDSIR